MKKVLDKQGKIVYNISRSGDIAVMQATRVAEGIRRNLIVVAGAGSDEILSLGRQTRNGAYSEVA